MGDGKKAAASIHDYLSGEKESMIDYPTPEGR
jgi:hypothetical protein